MLLWSNSYIVHQIISGNALDLLATRSGSLIFFQPVTAHSIHSVHFGGDDFSLVYFLLEMFSYIKFVGWII